MDTAQTPRAQIAIDADFSAGSSAAAPVNQPELIERDELLALSRRSDSKGARRLLLHVSTMVSSGVAYGWLILAVPTGALWSSIVVAIPFVILFGFTLASMFACMHECLHRTAFRNSKVNDSVAWCAGLLSFYYSELFRHSHGWHHRFTQVPGMDPELEDPKPSSMAEYWTEISGVTWWAGKIREGLAIVRGDLSAHSYVPDRARNKVLRSGRVQLGVYVLLVVGSAMLMAAGIVDAPLFVVFWLLPLVVGQPILRMILLADHTACTLDTNALTNTRTTYTWALVRVLMWEMPFHTEHHRYPRVPFHALAKVHERLKPHLGHVMHGGFVGAQRQIVARFPRGDR